MSLGKLVKLIICLTSVLGCGASLALSGDSDQPIEIEADAAELDDNLGVTVYRGNVVVTQGTLRLNGDTMTVYYTDDQKLKTVFMDGNPACFRQRPDKENMDVKAEALRMEYHAAEKLLVLLQDATVIRGRDRFSGDRIEYDTEKAIVKARKSNSSKDRVKMVIQPKKERVTESDAIIDAKCPGS
ncbi:MAG: lipopolysaccharide transport periplasmic protein LptA [Gammaproteobacteria bacterium]|nr:lipopolysaccharide transport periplasmic protein LptA [Gammaproteobacteria bacterium]MCI0590514.1 lipopolysaccharide transport periplasmic protein LptA [Gammaproteobacteria bacterium]